VVVYEEEMELIEVDEPLPSDSLKAAN
jgi:hypothetical protein